MRPIALIDFDHTLYNATSYLREFHRVVYSKYVRWKEFNQAFQRYTDGPPEQPFSSKWAILTFVPRSQQPFAIAQAGKFLKEQSGKFLYRDSRCFLEFLIRQDIEPQIITFADLDDRVRQIIASDLSRLVNKINIFSDEFEEKVRYVREVAMQRQPVLVIDDHPRLLSAVLQFDVRAIRLQRRVVRKYIGREPALPGVFLARTLRSARLEIERTLREQYEW